MRKNNNNEVRQNINMSSFMEAILDNSRVACILIVDHDGRILDISKGVELAFGYAKEELQNRNLSIFYSENDRHCPAEELKEAEKNGFALDNNYLLHKNGNPVWCQGESIMLKGEEGKLYFVKYVYDINKQKVLEKSLRAAMHLAQGITETINEALVVLDKDLRVIMTNTNFNENYNWEKKDLLHKPFLELNNQGWDVPKLRELLYKILPEKCEVENFEFNFERPGKGNRILMLNAKQIIEDGAKQERILIFITDITRQKMMSNTLESKNSELNIINQDLDTFVYTASHDLNAPVNNLQALIKLLKEEQNQEGRNEVLEMIDESLEKLRNTISDLAERGRAQARDGGDSSMIKFSDMTKEIKILLQTNIKESNAILYEDFSQAPTITFSRKNLRSILQNLISNAIKYRSPDRNPEIRISTGTIDRYVYIQITDNGLGIKEEDKAKVFNMYQRLHDHVEGTGVGLGIVARIVNNNRGKIEINSEVGKGTTFKVYLMA